MVVRKYREIDDLILAKNFPQENPGLLKLRKDRECCNSYITDLEHAIAKKDGGELIKLFK